MAEYQDKAGFQVCWQPFFLFTGVPDEGIPFLHQIRKLGGPELEAKVAARQGRLYELAKELDLSIDPQRRLSQSLLSHCLLDYAGRIDQAVQTELVEYLFLGHMADGEQLDDLDFLARMAEKAGIDRDGALEHVQDKSVQEAIKRSVEQAQSEIGTPKLPFMVMTCGRNPDLKLAFAGALPVSTLVALFDKLVA